MRPESLAAVPGVSRLRIVNRGGATRTLNRRFWRPVLYQLSYTPLCDCRSWIADEGVLALPSSPDSLLGRTRQEIRNRYSAITSFVIPYGGCASALCGKISL